LAKYVKMH